VLRELRIENLLLIERAELRLGEGLNAITGETGAGKTVDGGQGSAADRAAGS
jgi:DNA repair protein RecN (Recombination protein N)